MFCFGGIVQSECRSVDRQFSFLRITEVRFLGPLEQVTLVQVTMYLGSAISKIRKYLKSSSAMDIYYGFTLKTWAFQYYKAKLPFCKNTFCQSVTYSALSAQVCAYQPTALSSVSYRRHVITQQSAMISNIEYLDSGIMRCVWVNRYVTLGRPPLRTSMEYIATQSKFCTLDQANDPPTIQYAMEFR